MQALKSFLGSQGMVRRGQVFMAKDGEWRDLEVRGLACRVPEVEYDTKVVGPSETKPVMPETPKAPEAVQSEIPAPEAKHLVLAASTIGKSKGNKPAKPRARRV
jgi:hypothetical protein